MFVCLGGFLEDMKTVLSLAKANIYKTMYTILFHKKPGSRLGSKSFLICAHILVLKVTKYNEKIAVEAKTKRKTFSIVAPLRL